MVEAQSSVFRFEVQCKADAPTTAYLILMTETLHVVQTCTCQRSAAAQGAAAVTVGGADVSRCMMVCVW